MEVFSGKKSHGESKNTSEALEIESGFNADCLGSFENSRAKKTIQAPELPKDAYDECLGYGKKD